MITDTSAVYRPWRPDERITIEAPWPVDVARFIDIIGAIRKPKHSAGITYENGVLTAAWMVEFLGMFVAYEEAKIGFYNPYDFARRPSGERVQDLLRATVMGDAWEVDFYFAPHNGRDDKVNFFKGVQGLTGGATDRTPDGGGKLIEVHMRGDLDDDLLVMLELMLAGGGALPV